ncbi:T9SS type A sorting domain-containing protein [Aequorivita lipolytica]|uniref:T9SS type A sorting domain-containing protein n=1 Tax=Aequorivita lipolytica TaxID=153267 RepID=A0A5C6YQE8_9FLAO|nr:T9SS type A sorting domain-containing protein [Aequorivita lipolytica]TXD69084.1 T9SS type A sorting domain-containing protein [Aequorivita lipolytica]SRX51347.1 hypothetical protein AEQU2_01827 [Aequorivita lipolytica]
MRSIYIIFILLFCTQSIRAQDYTPILDYSNEWHFTTCNFGCYSDIYYTDGDTLVNGKMYKILDGYHYISRTFLLREEVAEKELYFAQIIPGGGIQEYLLYDFSLQVGDTIQMQNPISPFPKNGGFFKLDSIIPKPLVNGQDYDHLYFSPTPSNPFSTGNAVWVEGVGSLSLINAPGGKPDINGVGQLSCYFKNATGFYANLDSIDDCIPTVLDIPSNTLEKVVVSSIYGSGVCLLTNTGKITEATLYNLTGKKIETIINNFEKSISIDLSSYSSGVYLIVVNGIGGTKKTFRVIK